MVNRSAQVLNPDQSERSGILAGGNWIVDRPKIIDVYPAQDSLANILRGIKSCVKCGSSQVGEPKFAYARPEAVNANSNNRSNAW